MPESRSLENLPNRPVPTEVNYKLEDYQAFYHWLNAKPDSEIKVFPQSKRIKREDINSLNDKVVDKLSLQNVVSGSTRIIITLSNKKVLEFGSWEKFRKHDFQISPFSKSLSVTWDFYLLIPEYKMPQRHTLKVRFGSSLKPGEFIQLVMQHEEDYQIDEIVANAIVKVDFINPIISSELFNIIGEWYETLSSNFYEKKSFIFLKRNQNKLRHLIILLFLTTGAFFVTTIFYLINYKYNFLLFQKVSNTNIVLLYLLSLIGLYSFYIFGKYWSNRISRIIDRMEPYNLFEITKGDKNKLEEIDKQNSSSLKRIVREVSIALGADVLMVVLWKTVRFFI